MSTSPLVALMKHFKAPLTRDEYLKWDNLGKAPGKLTPEVESELPRRFQTPVETEEEMPKPPKEGKGVKGKTVGAPADFAGAVLPGKEGVEPRWDSEPANEPTRLSEGVRLRHDAATQGVPLDMENPDPNATELEPQDFKEGPEPEVPFRRIEQMPVEREQ